MSLPLLLYALYCAYRDRHKTRARRRRTPYSPIRLDPSAFITASTGNPYSLQDMYERSWRANYGKLRPSRG